MMDSEALSRVMLDLAVQLDLEIKSPVGLENLIISEDWSVLV